MSVRSSEARPDGRSSSEPRSPSASRTDWLFSNAYDEAADLQALAERFQERTGHYPEAILADKIFRTRENLRYCKEHGIRLSGPRLGRPPKELDPAILQLEAKDSAERNAIEGKFGQCKRRLGLGRVMAKLKGSSETAIAMSILAANLIRLLKDAWDSSRILSETADSPKSILFPSMPERTALYQLAA